MLAGEDAATDVIHVAIVGGGCAGLTTAFELSDPKLAGRHQINVYQQGWRLGGKGASGRGVAGRIEEHGLHVWLGFYENAFGLIRRAYAELAEHPLGSPFGDWRDAFLPEPNVGVFAPTGERGWQVWRTSFPPRPGLPGDPDLEPSEDPMITYVAGALAMLRTLVLDTVIVPVSEKPVIADDWPLSIRRMLDGGLMAGAVAVSQALMLLAAGMREGLRESESDELLALVQEVAAVVRDWTRERLLADHPDGHVWLVAELVTASLVGTVRHRLIGHPEGLDALDDWDCRDWLRTNGASEAAVQSPFMRGMYDLAMAYEDGDPARPRLAAGAALRGTVRMFFGYRGALFWRMRAGMGDTVFAPLYECLRRRGVRFHFFHRLTDVVLGADRSHVAALTFDRQATLPDNTSYDPLISVAGRPCWPAEARWEQLLERGGAKSGIDMEGDERDVAATEIVLRVGRDFDFVVLAVGVGALPVVASQLLARSPRWRVMVDQVKTVATQAFQLWLRDDLSAGAPLGAPRIASAFAKPFDTWCDMRHVIPEEGWAEAGYDLPAMALYFCGALADLPGLPAGAGTAHMASERVRRAAITFLEGPAGDVWPRLREGAQVNWARLVGDLRSDRNEGFYWRANVAASDRYTLCLPGSTRWRISPLALDFDNLTVAGDWTANGLNTGCIEAAVMSGMLASNALSGSPPLASIVGFDHP
ncbi:MAG: hypothetical protein K0S66_3026 [Sphingomonas sp.]|jgi:uncharacterized protein with NAD-binding domain and iron-sulfur cluster|nr:hypothetical protein [Sphingomonas sp.]